MQYSSRLFSAAFACVGLLACGQGPSAASPDEADLEQGQPVEGTEARQSASSFGAERSSGAQLFSESIPSELHALLLYLDRRKSTQQPRDRSLLVTELNGLERLYEHTSSSNPDRPQLVRRLAEGYCELRAAAVRDEQIGSGADVATASKLARDASARALHFYSTLRSDYPAYTKMDDVYLYAAIEEGWNKNLNNVRQLLLGLIEAFPRSNNAPTAYFTFGELFRHEGALDPSKYALAIAAYKEVLKRPDQNRTLCVAWSHLEALQRGDRLAASHLDDDAACAAYAANGAVAKSPRAPVPEPVAAPPTPVATPVVAAPTPVAASPTPAGTAQGKAALPKENRVALVIGNGSYRSGPLANPVNDAQLVSTALLNVGFQVKLATNQTRDEMKRSIDALGSALDAASIGLFYYAGHGVQVNGENYLIPVDANITSEHDVDIEAVSLSRVFARLEGAGNRMNFIVLDACRDNPFPKASRSGQRGLALANAPEGMLISYSTAPGAVASDGNDKNSPFSKSLASNLANRGWRVEDVFKAVRRDVKHSTSGKQVPWESSSLDADFWFVQ